MFLVASGMLAVVAVVSHVETVSEEKLSSSGFAELVDESRSEDLASVGDVPLDKVEFVHADNLSDTLLLRGQGMDDTLAVMIVTWTTLLVVFLVSSSVSTVDRGYQQR